MAGEVGALPAESASRVGRFLAIVAHGENEEERGGGGSRPARRAERRESPGREADGRAAEGERKQGGGGAMVEGGKEKQKKCLRMRERSRILPL
jgi:hypothetical protein